MIKIMFSKKGTKINNIFTVNLTITTYCQIDGEDFVNFCGVNVNFNTNDTFDPPAHRVNLNNKLSIYSRVKFNKSKLKFEKLTLCNGIRAVQCRGGSVRNGSEL
jgi:hypothetical protein